MHVCMYVCTYVCVYICIYVYIYMYICMAQLTVFEIALSSLRDVIIAASCSSTAAPDTANISVQLRSGCRLSVKQASPSTRHPKSSCMYVNMNRREYTRHTKNMPNMHACICEAYSTLL